MDYDKSTAQRTSYAGTFVDEGLRSYMLNVYNYMTLGLGLTGIIAYLVASSPEALNLIFGTPLKWVVFLAPIGFVFFFSMKIHTIRYSTAQVVFWVYSALMGLSLASIFIVYQMPSIARVFFITAGTFAAMSVYGYVTKNDLTAVGSFMFMGLIGLIIASFVNVFLQSSVLHFAISAIGVIVFVGLTAYDTQRIKQSYIAGEEAESAGKKAIMGALRLYLDFINLFILLLQLLGQRR
jgi:FtsH-binding integral membrane protein